MIKEAVLQVHRSAYGGIADYILQTTSSLLAAADCSFAKQLLEGRGRDLGPGPGRALAAGCWRCLLLTATNCCSHQHQIGELVWEPYSESLLRMMRWQCVFVTIFR